MPSGTHEHRIGLVEVRKGSRDVWMSVDRPHGIPQHVAPLRGRGARDAREHENDPARKGRGETRGKGLLDDLRLTARHSRGNR